MASPIDSSFSPATFAPFLMDPKNPGRLYAGSTHVYRTTNGGGNWAKASGDLTYGTTFADPDVLHTMALAAGQCDADLEAIRAVADLEVTLARRYVPVPARDVQRRVGGIDHLGPVR